MPKPKAYDPEYGYKYQILTRHPEYNGREWEHCDYAENGKEKDYLLSNYRQAYGGGFEFKVEFLPRKYWPAN